MIFHSKQDDTIIKRLMSNHLKHLICMFLYQSYQDIPFEMSLEKDEKKPLMYAVPERTNVEVEVRYFFPNYKPTIFIYLANAGDEIYVYDVIFSYSVYGSYNCIRF